MWEIWNKLNIPLIHEKSVSKKLKTLLNKYQCEIKFKTRPSKSSTFLQTIDKVFYIGKCQCAKTSPCCCGLIPIDLQEFIIDQHSKRKLTIPEFDAIAVEQQSTLAPASVDPTFYPGSTNMDVESEVKFAIPTAREPSSSQKRFHIKR